MALLPPTNMSNRCFNCGKEGHLAREYRKCVAHPPRDKGKGETPKAKA